MKSKIQLQVELNVFRGQIKNYQDDKKLAERAITLLEGKIALLSWILVESKISKDE